MDENGPRLLDDWPHVRFTVVEAAVEEAKGSVGHRQFDAQPRRHASEIEALADLAQGAGVGMPVPPSDPALGADRWVGLLDDLVAGHLALRPRKDVVVEPQRRLVPHPATTAFRRIAAGLPDRATTLAAVLRVVRREAGVTAASLMHLAVVVPSLERDRGAVDDFIGMLNASLDDPVIDPRALTELRDALQEAWWAADHTEASLSLGRRLDRWGEVTAAAGRSAPP